MKMQRIGEIIGEASTLLADNRIFDKKVAHKLVVEIYDAFLAKDDIIEEIRDENYRLRTENNRLKQGLPAKRVGWYGCYEG